MSRYRLLFVVLVTLAIWITAWATGLTARFTPESIRGFLAGKGPWGLVAFIFLFSIGQLLLRVPSPVFIAAAVAVYGRNLGLLVALLGILVSVTVSFAVVRASAGQALADVQRPFVRRLLSKIDSHPVMTVTLLRLVFQAAPPLIDMCVSNRHTLLSHDTLGACDHREAPRSWSDGDGAGLSC